MNWVSRYALHLIILVLLYASTFLRNSVWHDETGLWLDVVRKSPNNALALNNLCVSLYKETRYDDALNACLKSLRLEPEDWSVHLNLWQVYKAKGMWAEAQEESKMGLKLQIGKPEAYNMLGYYLLKKGWVDEAIRIFKIAIKKKPDLADSHYGLAVSLEKRGDVNSALRHYKEFLKFSNKEESGFKEVEKKVKDIEKGE